jgi:hypothetical protein
MLYFLASMNPDTVREIFTTKDGIEGVTRYGAVALRRALTSPRSNFYYKYQEVLYTYDRFNYSSSVLVVSEMESAETIPYKHLYNLPNQDSRQHSVTMDSLEKIDKVLDSF